MAVTAEQSLELLARSYSYDAVSLPPLPTEELQWTGSCIGIAGIPLLIGCGELEEIIETPVFTPVPGTKPWVLGIAAHKGGLLPIASGDALFGKRTGSARGRDYCMVIRRGSLYFAITLSHVERDLKFPVAQRDMQHPVDAAFAPFAEGGFHDGDRFLAVIDLDRLVTDSNVADAAAQEFDVSEDTTDE